MIDSVVFYSGALTAVAGALALPFAKKRRLGAAMLLGGASTAALALLLPVRDERIERRMSYLDDAMPRWQFNERHAIAIEASPARIFSAIHAVTAGEIRFFKMLTTIRRGFRSAPENILNAPGDEPLLDVPTRTTFIYLHDVAPREIVVGTEISRGKIFAAMNFLITPAGANRCMLSTETRVFSNTSKGARQFAIYWRIIHPGSDIIRRSWLQAIKRRAAAA
jgi:hypothetical protein